MKRIDLLIIILLVILGLGCGRKGVKGVVKDPFGKGIQGVSVKIVNSTISSLTDANGCYFIEYVPGMFTIKFSKQGYTMHTLDLALQKKALFPAETMIMYPIPDEQGVYYIGEKELVKLKSHTVKFYEYPLQGKQHAYFYAPTSGNLITKPGISKFIVNIPDTIFPVCLTEQGIIQHYTFDWGFHDIKYDGIINESYEEIAEKHLIRTIDLKWGDYAWVTMKNKIVQKESIYYPFIAALPLTADDEQEIRTLFNKYSEIIKDTQKINKDNLNTLIYLQDGNSISDTVVSYIRKTIDDFNISAINLNSISPSKENQALINMEATKNGKKETMTMRVYKIKGIWYWWDNSIIENSSTQKRSEKSQETSPKKQVLDQERAHPIPNFTLTNIYGKKISLNDFFKHKIILIHFWATWCPYCLTEIPLLKKIDSNLGKQVKVLAIDILEKSEKVKKFVEQKGIKYDVLLDQKGDVARKYGIKGTPTSIVIDRNENYAYFGYELPKAEKAIESLLEID